MQFHKSQAELNVSNRSASLTAGFLPGAIHLGDSTSRAERHGTSVRLGQSSSRFEIPADEFPSANAKSFCPTLLKSLAAFEAGSSLGSSEIRTIAQEALALADSDGRASRALGAELQNVERHFKFVGKARPLFEDLLARLGVASTQAVGLPLNDQPFWFRNGHPLANYQSNPQLPETADVVIIGAGLTGASAAYHLSDAVKNNGWRVVALDKGDPACEASGRNGGNFELMPENSVGIYEGLANERLAFLTKRYPKLAREILKAEAERQASLVLGLALRNRDRLKDIIRKEGIDCDFSPKGWLYLAHTEQEEQGICEEVSLAAQHGQKIEIWSRGKIEAEFGFKTDYLGRFIPGDGTYHPFKYVCGVFQAALKAGVELYTRTGVKEIVSLAPDSHRVTTERGVIMAKHVIVATNAFTSKIFPELRAIQFRQSQIMVTEHAEDRARGRIVTSENGPVFFNQPREGARNGRAPLLMGGGDDRAMGNPSSRRRSTKIHKLLLKLRDKYYPQLKGQPPSREWVGPMGFTPDQLPAIGFLRPGIIIAAGFNGYGGSYTTAAGQATAEMALTGEVPEWTPADVFSPRRLLSNEPLFMSEQESLWRIAASVCRQLKAVNQQLADAFNYGAGRAKAVSATERSRELDHAQSSSAACLVPETLKAFSAFKNFTANELKELFASMRHWELAKGTRLFQEGNPGGTCFLVVTGAVDVSTSVRGAEKLLATLTAGSLFGQVSLIDGEARSATCTVSEDAVLVEIERDACQRLFASQSKTALKFLAALNEGLIAALRGADRQLMRLNLEGRVRWNRAQRLELTSGPQLSEDSDVVAGAA